MPSENQKVEKMAELKREETNRKVMKALNKLKKQAVITKKPISINKLAKEAGVTRQTLYNRDDLMAKLDEINSLITDNMDSNIPYGAKQKAVQDQRIERLQYELAEVKSDFAKLLDQNEALTELNLKLQKHIADLEEKLYGPKIESDKVVELKNKR